MIMELTVNEVKTQAKKLLKAIKLDKQLEQSLKLPLKNLALASIDEIKLKHCLTIVSQQLGFNNWHQANEVLSGMLSLSEDANWGTFFYPKGSNTFINEWFASYQDARNALSDGTKRKWLLPYKKQFVVVEKEFLTGFNLDSLKDQLWTQIDYDMVKSYKSTAWDTLACQIIKNRAKSY